MTVPHKEVKEYPFLSTSDKGVTIELTVQPRSSRNSIEGVFDNTLKVKLTSPPVDNEANASVIKLFSKVLKVSKESIEITGGVRSKKKRITVSGPDVTEVQEKLSKHI
ncbi:MAG: DUF167 domain-containing protein [Deltaproteobacteria bacterium]|nr:DUF167 domain-containing protein [Deltaproteobacteria bacterium]